MKGWRRSIPKLRKLRNAKSIYHALTGPAIIHNLVNRLESQHDRATASVGCVQAWTTELTVRAPVSAATDRSVTIDFQRPPG
jgi:hypothetical protein